MSIHSILSIPFWIIVKSFAILKIRNNECIQFHLYNFSTIMLLLKVYYAIIMLLFIFKVYYAAIMFLF